MSKRTDDLHEKVEGLRAELVELGDVEVPTDEQVARSTEALAEFKAAHSEYEASRAHDEEMAAIRSIAIEKPHQVERVEAPNVAPSRQDPFADLEAVRVGYGVTPRDMRDRALRAIESDTTIRDEYRETASKLVEKDGKGNIARHALLTGSPAYRSAFNKWLQHPETVGQFLDAEESDAVRTALSTTVGNGGYAIPFLLDPSVILTNDGTANPFRQVSKIVKGTSNKWNGLVSAGVTAEWKSEGSQAADASPTFTQPSITAYLADAYVFGSYEVLQDTDLENEIPNLIADAKDRLESDAFAVGSGSAAPFGVVTSTTAVTASRVSPTTGGTFTSASIADVYKTIAALPPRHRSKATHVANYAVLNLIRQMSASAAGSAFWVNLGASVPEQLLGLPVYEASAMASSMTTGSNILLTGDFSNYVIYDRIGMSLEYIPNVVGSNQRPTGQRGFFATWRVGADVVNPNAFRVLKL